MEAILSNKTGRRDVVLNETEDEGKRVVNTCLRKEVAPESGMRKVLK